MTAELKTSMEKEAEEQEEEVEDLLLAEKLVDPLREAKIKKTVDGQNFEGVVEDIAIGRISKKRFYRIKYNDGDMEHMTEEDLRQHFYRGINTFIDLEHMTEDQVRAEAEKRVHAKWPETEGNLPEYEPGTVLGSAREYECEGARERKKTEYEHEETVPDTLRENPEEAQENTERSRKRRHLLSEKMPCLKDHLRLP